MEDNDKEKEKKEQPPIADQVKEYLETYIRLTKLRAVERGTSMVAAFITDLFIVLCLSLTFLFASITLALFLGKLLHSAWGGFGIVSLVYIVIILFVTMFRGGVERPIVNFLIKRLLK